MNRTLALVLCLFLALGIAEKASASDVIRCDFLSRVDALKRSTLAKEITLHNSPEIFREIAGLFNRPTQSPSVQKTYPTAHLIMALLTDPEADKLKFEETFAEGDTIYDVISTFVHRRARDSPTAETSSSSTQPPKAPSIRYTSTQAAPTRSRPPGLLDGSPPSSTEK